MIQKTTIKLAIILAATVMSSCTYCTICDYTTNTGYATSETCGSSKDVDAFQSDLEGKYNDVVCVDK